MQDDTALFWGKVDKRGDDECWEWLGAFHETGYGVHYFQGQTNRAHRVSYIISNGRIPDGCVVRHTCDNLTCVNPKHLIVGSHADNVQDRVERGRSAKGSKHGRSKLTAEGVRIAKYCMTQLGISPCTLAKISGMDPAAFRSIKSGKTWRDIEKLGG